MKTKQTENGKNKGVKLENVDSFVAAPHAKDSSPSKKHTPHSKRTIRLDDADNAHFALGYN